MPNLSRKLAILRAREALALREAAPARTNYVVRLDSPGKGYYLVVFGAEDASIAAAVVDAGSGDVGSCAHLSGAGPHLPVSAARAAQLAGAAPLEPQRLVWRPSRASLSMLSPIWLIRTARGPVYVDQQGRRWKALEPAGPDG